MAYRYTGALPGREVPEPGPALGTLSRLPSPGETARKLGGNYRCGVTRVLREGADEARFKGCGGAGVCKGEEVAGSGGRRGRRLGVRGHRDVSQEQQGQAMRATSGRAGASGCTTQTAPAEALEAALKVCCLGSWGLTLTLS